jgi:hypothetical protein
MEMFPKVIGFAKDNRTSTRPRRITEPCGKSTGPSPLILLDLPVEHYVLQFAQEFFDVLEVPVHRGEPHVGDLVQHS